MTCEEMETWPNGFSVSSLDSGGWLASRAGRFPFGESPAVTQWIKEIWYGYFEVAKIFSTLPGIET